MKRLQLFLTVIITVVLGVTSTTQAQNNMTSAKTETFKVLDNCDMCKTRIEKAVREDGATSANWDQKTKMLTVTFDPSKTSVEEFSKKLAGAGHDTKNFKAEDKVYNSLPACCKYDRATAAIQADYTCPMHSDVHSDNPGKCPKCGMALVQKKVSKSGDTDPQHSMEGMHKN